jgi:tetratricopeptide (TPR) repeat protein
MEVTTTPGTGESANNTAVADLDAPAPTPGRGDLVGRAAELELLRAGIDDAISGRPTILLLVGDAGIGKSRLADETAVVARGRGMRVLHGEATASSREPLALWRGVLRSLDVEPAADPMLSGEDRRWEQLEAIADALSSCGPALVVLDDLHWADSISLWVLEHLGRSLGGAPVTVLATTRDHEPEMLGQGRLRRVARVVPLGGLAVDAVGLLATAEGSASVDAAALHARTGGNPLFVQELVRSPDGEGVIGDVLLRSLRALDPDTQDLLSLAAIAGAHAPLALLARAAGCPGPVASERMEPARQAGVVDVVDPTGVRFHHDLLADAAARLADRATAHERLATAWATVDGVDARAEVATHRLGATEGTTGAADAVRAAREVAAELTDSGQHEAAARVLTRASAAGADLLDDAELRAQVALDLARALRQLGDLGPALACYREAADLAHRGADPVTLAKAEIGANLWVSAFVPDPDRVRRLEAALDGLPADELALRCQLLGRLTVVAGADLDATEQVRAWADEAVALARAVDDPVLIAQATINQTMSPPNRAALEARIDAADEVVALAEHAGRSDLALYGHQRRVSHHLNHGDLGSANLALSRAELLAELLPSPGWRQRTLVQRATLLALSGARGAAVAATKEAAATGAGHIEPMVLLGTEVMHWAMLVELYGHSEERADEVWAQALQVVDDVPSPLVQIQKGFCAQLLGDDERAQDVLHRYAHDPQRILRSMTGDHLLRILGDLIARAGATAHAAGAYQALLPYAGLLNVGGGSCAGMPVDDVLGRLALLLDDRPAALRHAQDAVALARAMPSPPLLVHALEHLADATERVDGRADEIEAIRAEADALAPAAAIERPTREQPAPPSSSRVASDGAPTRPAAMRREGPHWLLTSPLGDARLADGIGLGQLARLLATPGVELSALELSGRAATPVAADLGPGLDARAKRAYRERLLELQAEVDDAEAANDLVRGERAHVEMDALVRELKRAVGLGGRDRPTGSDAERARVNVARSLRRAIAAIGDQAPLLGAHLTESVRTGGYCLYLPASATALHWTVVSDPSPTP